MSKLDELERLADEASKLNVEFGTPNDDAAIAFIKYCSPATIKQMVAIMRKQNKCLISCVTVDDELIEALAAFDAFDKGE